MINGRFQSSGAGAVNYTVEHRGNCVLVFGEVPLAVFGGLTRMVPKDAVMDTVLARMTGSSFAMGLIVDTKALRESERDSAIARAHALYAHTGLSAEAIRWLATGERGASSDAMFFRLAGIKPRDMISEVFAHPHDPDDLRRCRLLLEQVPELAGRIAEMGGVSPTWAALIAQWDDICLTMDQESPQWRTGKGSAKKTSEMMKRCIAGVKENSEGFL